MVIFLVCKLVLGRLRYPNFLVSNGPHSDGDTTGFSLAAMWGVESNVNVKSTNSGSPIWPNGLGVFGFQAVGASTAQVGDGGGGGEALAFSETVGDNNNPR